MEYLSEGILVWTITCYFIICLTIKDKYITYFG